MSVTASLATGFRALVLAAAAAGAALGLLAVFHPFAPPSATAIVTSGGDSDALRHRIDTARAGLADIQTALDNVNGRAVAVSPSGPDTSLRAQYEAQIADAIERRDLARRQAAAIREAMKLGLPIASLAGIRESVVIGQLLARQAALDAQIAEQGARFKKSHPIMRALFAQRDSLAVQIRAQAASIVAALESEAELDDKQIAVLQTQLGTAAAAFPSLPTVNSTLAAKAAAQRAELDILMDAYFKLPSATAVASPSAPALLTLPNLLVVAVAGIAALTFQIALVRRRHARDSVADMAMWEDDVEPELPIEYPEPVAVPLRRAS